MRKDVLDITFRVLFSCIFLALGFEHLINDDLIQKLIPPWLPHPELLSLLAGVSLIIGGSLIVLGFKLRFAAILLASFLIAVTLVVHAPSLLEAPDFISEEEEWLWLVFQRSNYAKNLCLLGVCLMLFDYQPRRWSLDTWLKQKQCGNKYPSRKRDDQIEQDL